MRFIDFIEEPKTIDRIIPYPDLSFQVEWSIPPHNAQQNLLLAAEERDEYF
jgi:hypothetical protein